MDQTTWQKGQRLLNEETLKEISKAQPYQQERGNLSEQKEVNSLVHSLNDPSKQDVSGETSTSFKPVSEKDEESPVSDFGDLEDATLFHLLATDPITDKWTKGLEYILSKTEIQRAKKLLTTLIDKGFYFTHYNHMEKDGIDYGNITLTLYHLYGNKSKEIRFFETFKNFKEKMEELQISLKSCTRAQKSIPNHALNSNLLMLLEEQEKEEAKRKKKNSARETS